MMVYNNKNWYLTEKHSLILLINSQTCLENSKIQRADNQKERATRSKIQTQDIYLKLA